jgi:hypothetical protein
MAGLRRWKLYGREYWLWLALWVVGTVLVTHFLLHGGTDLSAFLAVVAVGVVCYGIVIAARFVPLWHKHRL